MLLAVHKALHVVHSSGYVHGRLSEHNLLVTLRGVARISGWKWLEVLEEGVDEHYGAAPHKHLIFSPNLGTLSKYSGEDL